MISRRILPSPHRGQLGGDDLEMPVHRQLGLRVEVVEAARGEGAEVLPQQDLVLGPGQVLDHHCFPFREPRLELLDDLLVRLAEGGGLGEMPARSGLRCPARMSSRILSRAPDRPWPSG